MARSDIDAIWKYTLRRYDLEQAESYKKLIRQALKDIQIDPERVGSKRRPDIGEGIRSFPISFARRTSRVKTPRHIVVYANTRALEVFVLRILHDAMDIPGQEFPVKD